MSRLSIKRLLRLELGGAPAAFLGREPDCVQLRASWEERRFRDPEPARTVGLAWRRTSPRKADFAALGQIVRDMIA